MHNPADVATALGYTKRFEQGKDFAARSEPSLAAATRSLEKDIDNLTKQMQQMTLNYATIASALTEPNVPTPRTQQRFQPRTQYQLRIQF
jgi:hypothetical protein